MIRVKAINLNIAIIGGGFAGVYCAKTLRRRLPAAARSSVGIIAEENHMVFQPMLPEVAGASISPRHVVNPLRHLCRGVQVFKGQITRILWPERKLILNAGPFTGNIEVQFEHLVLALGAVIDLSRIPGMPEHAFLLQNVGDAMHLRATIISRIEEANLESNPEIKRRLLSFVVVGGGYSGVETAGHILDLFRSIHTYYTNVSLADLQVFLIHGRDHLLPTLHRNLGEYCARKLAERGLHLKLDVRVKAVTANRVCLEDGSHIESNTVISTVGNAPHPLILRLCEEHSLQTVKGRILTEPTCQVPNQGHLWAAGDCAAVPFVKGDYCPSSAQFAMRQGILLGKNLARAQQGQPLEPFRFEGFGEMASIGHHSAVASIFGINFSGFVAWWLWRTVYLMKLPGLDRKIRVMLDWTFDLFFPRDINLLSPRYSTLLKEVHLQEGDVLFRAGEPAFSLYIVKSGSIRLVDSKGEFARLSTGEYFGEKALLEEEFRDFEAVAAEPSVLVSIPSGIFHQMAGPGSSLGRLFRKSSGKYQSREIIEAVTGKISKSIRALKASDLMQRDVKTLNPNMTAREALTVMKESPHSCYPVVDEEGVLQGVFAKEELYEFLKKPDTSPETRLHELAVMALPIIPETLTVPEIVERLIRAGATKLLVANEKNQLMGIVTIMDLVAMQQTAG